MVTDCLTVRALIFLGEVKKEDKKIPVIMLTP